MTIPASLVDARRGRARLPRGRRRRGRAPALRPHAQGRARCRRASGSCGSTRGTRSRSSGRPTGPSRCTSMATTSKRDSSPRRRSSCASRPAPPVASPWRSTGPGRSARSATSRSILADLAPAADRGDRASTLARRGQARPSWRSRPKTRWPTGSGSATTCRCRSGSGRRPPPPPSRSRSRSSALFVKASPGVQGYGRLNLLRFPLGRLLADRRIRFAVRLVSVGFLALVLAASLAGDQSPTRNIAPTFIWVAWWVGFAYLSALVGQPVGGRQSVGRALCLGRGARSDRGRRGAAIPRRSVSGRRSGCSWPSPGSS